MEDFYRFHKLGLSNRGSLISVDESLFVKQNSTKIWVVGAKNNGTLNVRLDLFTNRTEEDFKKFITNHIKPHNRIITDGWNSYNFLDKANSEYEH